MYQAIFENVGTALVMIEKDMSISLINDEFSRLFGYTRKDVEGKKSWTSFFIEDDHDKIKKYHQPRSIVSNAPPWKYEARLLNRDGGIKDVIVTVIAVPGRDKSIATLAGISERKQEEELYHSFANSLQIGVYVVQDGRIVFANPHIPRYSGYSMDELLGSDILSYVHPEDREMVRENAIRMVKGEQSSPYEYRITNKNGQVRWLMERVLPIYYKGERAILGNTMDITEIKETREKLEKQNILESSILTSTPHAIFGFENRRIIFVNAAVEKVFGWEPDEIIGKNSRILFRSDEEYEEIGKTVYTVLENKAIDIREPKFPYRRKDGKEIFCRAVSARMGDILVEKRIVTTFEDITERKQAEEALRTSEERYRAVIDNIAIGVSLISPDMEILDLNTQMRTWYPRVDVSTRPICYRTFNDPPREAICSYCPTSLTLQDGMVHESITETPLRDEIRNYKIISSPIKDAAGNVTAAIEMVEDVTEGLAIQERLSGSERLYRTLFETTGAATILVDDDMTILMTNEMFENLTGYAKQEIDGKKKWTEFVDKCDLKRLKKYHKLRRIDPNAPPKTYEFTFTDRYGEKKEILSTVSIIPETKRSIASFWDISDLKRKEESLRHSEQEKSVLNKIANVFLTCPDEEMYGKVLDIVLEVMKSKYGIFGYIGDNRNLIIPSLTREIWGECKVSSKSIVFPSDTWGESLWGRAIRERKAFYSGGSFHTPEGHVPINHFLTVPIVFGQETIGLLSVANKEGGYTEEDKKLQESIANFISPILNARLQRDSRERERKQAEIALRESEEKYRLLAENISDIIWTMDTNLRATYVSPSVEKLRGYNTDEAKNQTLREILTPASYKVAINAFKQGMAREQRKQGELEGPISLELEMIRKDGSTVWTEVNMTFLRDSEGRMKEILGITRDITKRKKAEDELRIKSHNLEETNTALKVLLEYREKDKEELQGNVLSNVRESIIPYIEKVKTCRHKSEQEQYLSILETNLNNITSPFLRNLSLSQCKLTPKEIQIANLIKDGKTTKEMADLLRISVSAINYHRDNIRKKLGLTNTKVNLQSHLSSLA